MDIEKLATSTLTNLISRTDYLESHISEGDREPHWDGPIHVFTDKSKRQEKTAGRVHTQVKGQLADDLTPETITYPVRIHFSRLSKEDREEFSSFPIYHLLSELRG